MSCFADILERHLPSMRAFARSLCYDATLADDLVQDACLKAWNARERFVAGSDPLPWLFTILRNEYLMVKRRSWRQEHHDHDTLAPMLVDDDHAGANADARLMMAAIEALPTEQREALILVLAAGFTYEEAGTVQGVPSGTVKSRVARARAAVAGRLEAAGEPDARTPRLVPSDATLETALMAVALKPAA